jgi:hypothetical protein
VTMLDPKTLTDEQLKDKLRAVINPMVEFVPATPEEKGFNYACLQEYITRGLTDYVIDDFIEYMGMMGVSDSDG